MKVSELLASGVAPWQLPTLKEDATIDRIYHPDYDYWYRYVDPKTGDVDEVRGRYYWHKERLVHREETWIS
jgi:hypothetical protein